MRDTSKKTLLDDRLTFMFTMLTGMSWCNCMVAIRTRHYPSRMCILCPCLHVPAHRNSPVLFWFFRRFSSYDESLSKFCLAHLFTALVNKDGILGLSYVASTQRHNPGGICSEGDTTIRTLTPASFVPTRHARYSHLAPHRQLT